MMGKVANKHKNNLWVLDFEFQVVVIFLISLLTTDMIFFHLNCKKIWGVAKAALYGRHWMALSLATGVKT